MPTAEAAMSHLFLDFSMCRFEEVVGPKKGPKEPPPHQRCVPLGLALWERDVKIWLGFEYSSISGGSADSG